MSSGKTSKELLADDDDANGNNFSLSKFSNVIVDGLGDDLGDDKREETVELYKSHNNKSSRITSCSKRRTHYYYSWSSWSDESSSCSTSSSNSGSGASKISPSTFQVVGGGGDVVKGLPRRRNRQFQDTAAVEKFSERDDDDGVGVVEEESTAWCFRGGGGGVVGEGNDADSEEASPSCSSTITSAGEGKETCIRNFVSASGTSAGSKETLIKQQQQQQLGKLGYLQIQSTSPLTSLSSCWIGSGSSPPGTSGYYHDDYSSSASLEASDQQAAAATTSLESASGSSWCSTVSFLTEIEVKPASRTIENCASDVDKVLNDEWSSLSLTLINMETSEQVESTEKVDQEPPPSAVVVEGEEEKEGEKGSDDGGDDEKSEKLENPKGAEEGEDNEIGETPTVEEEEEEEEGGEGGGEEDRYGDRAGSMDCEGEGFDEDEEDDDTTTLSSEAVVDDIELILMPEMCHDMSSANLSPKLVRVTELKLNADDVFCDDETDEDQSSRHEFRSIVDEVCEEEEGGGQDPSTGRMSVGDDDVSSGSEFISAGGGGRRRVSGACAGESSKSSSSSGARRRRSTSGRINSGVQTDITAVEEPAPLSGGHGFRKKSSGKSTRLGIPGGGGSANGKKLNWKSELTLLPSKMKVKQSGFNSFESNDERDQYSPRVAKFTSQDTLNLSSQFLKPSTLYRTRNLSRNLNQFASSESTFMLPMSSEQQLSSCGVGESPRFRDRVSSSTSAAGAGGGVGGAGNFKGAATSYSAYQISSILSGGGGGGGACGGGVGMGTPLSSARLSRHPQHQHAHHQPLISGYSGGGAGHMMMMSSRQFRSSMPDLNAVNKSYAAVAAATMADSHRRRQPSTSKSIKHSSSSSRHRHPHHHSSTSSAGGGGYRLQKRSSSDEETSSLIDESERCLRSSIDLLLTDELPSPGAAAGIIGGDSSCFRSSAFGGSSAANVGGSIGFHYHSSRRSCSQPILNDQAYPPEMKDPSMGSPFLPRKLSDMRCSRWAKVILPNGHVAVVSVKETDEIQESLTVHTDTGCVINLPFRKVVFAWRSSKR